MLRSLRDDLPLQWSVNGVVVAMAPLVILIIVLGVFPKPMLDVIEPAVQATMQQVGVSDPAPQVSGEGGR